MLPYSSKEYIMPFITKKTTDELSRTLSLLDGSSAIHTYKLETYFELKQCGLGEGIAGVGLQLLLNADEL